MDMLDKKEFVVLAKSGVAKVFAKQIDNKGFALACGEKILATGTGNKKQIKLYKGAKEASLAIMKEGIYNFDQPQTISGVNVEYSRGSISQAEKLRLLKEDLKNLEIGLEKKKQKIQDTKKQIAEMEKSIKQ